MEHKQMLIDKAYGMIKEMILLNKLAPGQKLIYGDLCRIFNMSSTPIINALYRLEHEGIVVSKPFKGFYVNRIGLQEALDLFGVREALEIYVAEQLIRLDDTSFLPALEKKFNRHAVYRPEVYDRKRFILDSEFHLQMASSTGNQMLTKRLSMTLEHFYIRFKFDMMPLERLQSSVEEHRRIIEAIRNRDVGEARAAVRNHIHNARNQIMQALDEEQDFEKMSVG